MLLSFGYLNCLLFGFGFLLLFDLNADGGYCIWVWGGF